MARFIYPLDNYTLTQGFGANPAFYKQFGQHGHNGLDLGAPTGTPVKASADGTVDFEGWGQNSNWMGQPAGICIILNHGDVRTGYAHLNSTIVNRGQRVSRGQLIGYVGATGLATGPHLHFEFLGSNYNNGYGGRLNPSSFDLGKNTPVGGGKLMTPNFISETYWGFQKRRPSQQEIDFHMANSNPESFVNGFQGQYAWKSLEASVSQHQSQIAALQKQVTDLRNDVTAMQQKVAEKNAELTAASETIARKDVEIAALNAEVERLKQHGGGGIDEETRRTVQETGVIVKWIQNVLAAVFNRSK